MTHEERQRSLLMAQISKKRALKEKYLRPRTQQEHPLTALVMTNALFLAIRERVDLFGALAQFSLEAPQAGQATFHDAMACLQALADLLKCGVSQLFSGDTAEHRPVLERLLHDLQPCDAWEDIHTDDRGCGSFALPGFDYACRMSQRPRATLHFSKEASSDGFRYTLTLGAEGSDLDLLPRTAVLWQESRGPLQQFTDGVLAEVTGDHAAQKALLEPIRREILSHGETLADLTRLLQEVPEGLALIPLLQKEAAALRALRSAMQTVCDGLPHKLKTGSKGARVKDALILLGGAAAGLERLCAHPSQISSDELGELAYMVKHAGAPVF